MKRALGIIINACSRCVSLDYGHSEAGSNADGDESRRICFRHNRAVLTKEADDRVGPILRRIPARVVGVSFRPEHVKDR